MRFRKSIRLGKGLRLNLSKSGISTTVGVKGLSVNLGKNGAYLNTGIPGSGLYDRKKITLPSGKTVKMPKNTAAFEEWHDKSLGQKIFMVLIGTAGLIVGLLFLLMGLDPNLSKAFLVAGIILTVLSMKLFHSLWKNKRIKAILKVLNVEEEQKRKADEAAENERKRVKKEKFDKYMELIKNKPDFSGCKIFSSNHDNILAFSENGNIAVYTENLKEIKFCTIDDITELDKTLNKGDSAYLNIYMNDFNNPKINYYLGYYLDGSDRSGLLEKYKEIVNIYNILKKNKKK